MNNVNNVNNFTDEELLYYISTEDDSEAEKLFALARKICDDAYGRKVFFRGLIEFTNYCKNNCFYCGIRRSRRSVRRYRLSAEDILNCCQTGDALGFKTFVLQGGEDPFFTAERMTEIVAKIRAKFPAHAVTLSIGERSSGDYEAFYRAGANRYLLRHESADNGHYRKMHPAEMTLSNRKHCLFTLKKTGYQTGAGFMVGSPFQTPECLLADLRFLEELRPQMVGIGPFIPASGTPFAHYAAGGVKQTLRMVALARILLPHALIPATTALATLDPAGREKALAAGANVVMPNLSPPDTRKFYSIYNNKASAGAEAAESLRLIKDLIIAAGFEPCMERGDYYEQRCRSKFFPLVL